jgi:hypothetical protein
MFKRLVTIACFLILILSTFLQAENVSWSGNGDGLSWADGANWTTSNPPTASDWALMNGPGHEVSLLNGQTGYCDKIRIANADDARLNLNSTSNLTIYGTSLILALNVGGQGILDINGGTISATIAPCQVGYRGSGQVLHKSGSAEYLNIILAYQAGSEGYYEIQDGLIQCSGIVAAKNGSATMLIEGGVISSSGTLTIAQGTDAVGHVQLNDGTLFASDILFGIGQGSMDILSGKLITNGNDQPLIQQYVSDGLITGYGQIGNVVVDYNSQTNQTVTMLDIANSAKASNPHPANLADSIDLNVYLEWSGGLFSDGQEEYDLYFGTSNESLIDANYYSDEFWGTVDSNYICIERLSGNETYYWKVNTVYDQQVVNSGDIWSFNTKTIPEDALVISPKINQTNCPLITDMIWFAGTNTELQDIYIGTDYNSVMMAYEPSADLSADGLVDLTDLQLIADHWLEQPIEGPDPVGDLDANGVVTFDDYSIWAFQNGSSASADFIGSFAADVNSYTTGLLDPETTYFYRIDQKNYIGINKGDVLSFTTGDSLVVNPLPVDGANEVSLMSPGLIWDASVAVTTHNVYVGTNPNPGAQDFQGSVNDTYFSIDTQFLAPQTTYYWRVDGVIDQNTTIAGPVWNFTTEPAAQSFSIFDASSESEITLQNEQVTKNGYKTIYSAQGDNIQLYAEFEQTKDYLEVTGTVTNSDGNDRAVIVSYLSPVSGANLVFGNELNDSVEINEQSQIEGNLYPVAALCNDDYGKAIAIPPSEPRIFGLTGGLEGITIKFYLGLTSQTLNFPNSASFNFIIYPTLTEWGFRGAISEYYSFFPDYYSVRGDSDGLLLLNRECDSAAEPPDMNQMGFDRPSGVGTCTPLDVERDDQYNVLTLPSINVGVREIRFLPDLPADYDEAMTMFDEYCTSGANPELCEQILSSTCKKTNGEYYMDIRWTAWGGNSITFVTNPSPYLSYVPEDTVGHAMLEDVNEWLSQHQSMDGFFVDSIAGWSSLLDYENDHWTDTLYPLTFDPDAKLAMHNKLPHYEFINSLRERFHAEDRYIFANGIRSYSPIAAEPEQYNDVDKIGQFFICSLIDIGSSETGVNASQGRFEYIRTSMGPKHYVIMNQNWKDDYGANENWMHKCLCYGVFGTNLRNDYLDDPDGYYRYENIVNWFVPRVRTLARAGWQPVTNAQVTGESMHLERFGSGDQVYFTIMSEHQSSQQVTMTMDLNALEFDSCNYQISEIAGTSVISTNGNTVSFMINPYRTVVVSLTKTD